MSWNNFFWVPYFQGKGLVYYQFFGLVATVALLVLAGLLFLGYLVLAKVLDSALFKLLTHSRPLVTDSGPQPVTGPWLSHLVLQLAYLCLGLIGPVNSGLGNVSDQTGFTIMFTALLGFLLHSGVQAKLARLASQYQFYQTAVRTRIAKACKGVITFRGVFLSLLVSFIVTAFFSRTCVDFYQDQSSLYSYALGIGFNTQLTRWLTLQEACPPGPPCHIYASLPEDSESSVFINIQTHTSVNKVEIKVSPKLSLSPQCMLTSYEGLQARGARNVFNCRVDGLIPGRLHEIEVFYDGRRQASRNYQSIENNRTNIRMVNGGDVGDTRAARMLTEQAAKLSPDVITIGGDLAYDDNMGHCYYAWDRLLNMLDEFSQAQQKLIPYIMAVGNHDVGLNQLPGINITVSA